jgi:septum formation protein
MADFYLASRSPRRRELLQQIGARFETLLLRISKGRGADVDELQHSGEDPQTYNLRIAREKAEVGLRALAGRSMMVKPVLAADTVVVVDGEILGKPVDPAQAAAFLRRIAGRTHEVRTAVALATASGRLDQVWTAESVSQVTLREVSDAEIERYCATAEPYDKAGGYAIQGRAAVFIEWLQGSYSGVVGLPLMETAALLTRAGIRIL